MLWKWRSTAFINNATGDGSKLGNPLLIYKKLTEINSNLIRKLAIGWWISRWMDAGCWTFRHQHRSTVQLWKIYMKRPSWCSLLLIVSITTVHFSRWRPYEIFMNRAGFQRPNCGSEFRINPPPLHHSSAPLIDSIVSIHHISSAAGSNCRSNRVHGSMFSLFSQLLSRWLESARHWIYWWMDVDLKIFFFF